VREEETETGLTERLIMAMASEVADIQRATTRACVIFQALAEAAGVSVVNAFATE
jgi:hypothetical protein